MSDVICNSGHKVWSGDPKGSMASFQGIDGYISVMAISMFTYFFN